MDSFELSLERDHARQMQFLQGASPDDWHRYAYNHNWDDRLDGLFWIVSQPECDLATALLIFWKGEPTCYDYENETEEMGDDSYAVAPMLRHIAVRCNTVGFTRSQIAYDFLEDHGLNDPQYSLIAKAGRKRDFEELVERQRDVTDPLVKLHPDLARLRIAGRKVGGLGDDSDFYERFPEDRDDDGDHPGDTLAARPLTERVFAPAGRDNANAADTGADASQRIRALRHQAGGKAAPAGDGDRTGGVSAHTVKARIAAGIGDALFDAFGLFASIAAFGFACAFAPKFLFQNTPSLLFSGVAVAAIAYCLYSAFSNLRTLQRAVEENGLELSANWLKITTTVAAVGGIALGKGSAVLLSEPAVTAAQRYGVLVPAISALLALSYALTRFLIHPRAVHLA